ncbi:replication endonuclease [Shewanella algae]|uniref:replication endonuclease n=1 Tax=Shewanella algae TaxID=38313 RepID=UPI0031F49B40
MDLQQFERQAGVSIPAIFATAKAQNDLKHAQRHLERLPDDVAATMFREYIGRWRRNERSANMWMRKRSSAIKQALTKFPLPLWHINTEIRRAAIATEWADRCNKLLKNATHFGTTQLDARVLLHIVKQPADQWGFCPPLPSFTDYEQRKESGEFDISPAMYDGIASAIARLIDDGWWARQLESAWRRWEEHAAIIMGKVRKGVSPYLSNKATREFRSRRQAAQAWLNSNFVVNEQQNLELLLADAVAASIANPENRRAELMVRMRGFEEYAFENHLIGGFFTATAPSKYHAFINDKNGKFRPNDKYQGATPKETSNYLNKVWAKVRSKLAREGLPIFGFRVCEPHHDATPHWHLLLFFRPEHEDAIKFIMADYFTQEDRQELAVSREDFDHWAANVEHLNRRRLDGQLTKLKTAATNVWLCDLHLAQLGQEAGCMTQFLAPLKQQLDQICRATEERIQARFTYTRIDIKKGSATGYIAKYVAKNIDGAHVADDWEGETSGSHGAEGVVGWASMWGIRQFQQIGGPSVTVWRELRRLNEIIEWDDVLETARNCADLSNWRGFIDAMGGANTPRVDRPVQLFKAINEAASKYGEDVQRIKGVIGQESHTPLETRLDGWEISRRSLSERQNNLATGEGNFGDGSRQAFESGDSRAPWSSDNNCTQGTKDQKRIGKFEQEAAKLGLEPEDLALLRHGSVINSGGVLIRLRDNMLLVSKASVAESERADDWSTMDSHFDAAVKHHQQHWRKQLREQAWQLLQHGGDVEQWIAGLPNQDTQRLALEQLADVIELERIERRQQQHAERQYQQQQFWEDIEEDEPF